MILFFVCIAVILYLFYRNYQKNCDYIEEVTSLNRGEKSERSLILALRKSGLPANIIFLLSDAHDFADV